MRRTFLAIMLLAVAAPALFAQPPAPAPAPAEVPDPARLAAAERLVDLIMAGDLLRRSISLEMAGPAAAETPPEQLGFPADPHFRERTEIRARVTREVIAEAMTGLEPVVRRLFASFFARQFNLAEIGELTAFFSTPTGRKYAEVTVMLGQDPIVMEGMRAMMPLTGALVMRIDERVQAATAHLPRPVDEEMVNMSNAQ